MYEEALCITLGGDPTRALFVDETHRDRNATRRRRGWGKIGEKLIVRRYFDDPVRYTCIAECDYFGFIPTACDVVFRDDISREGAAGTVDADRFVKYVKESLTLSLGSYERGVIGFVTVYSSRVRVASKHAISRLYMGVCVSYVDLLPRFKTLQ